MSKESNYKARRFKSDIGTGLFISRVAPPHMVARSSGMLSFSIAKKKKDRVGGRLELLLLAGP